nr:MAG TPA: hypothetical protein [Caudoviricetes sp.]
MKNYKNYNTQFIGSSDIASLTLRSPEDSYILNFGEDNAYTAYIVDENAEIGSHYVLKFECKNWLKIYDDDSLTAKFEGKEIKVYRAKEMGCIIQIIK